MPEIEFAYGMRITAGGVMVQGGRILLGHRRSDRKYHPGAWDIFGGHCEHGESPEQALVRELIQELGVTPTCFDRIGIFEEPDPEKYGPGQHHLFRVRAWTGQPANVCSDEHDAIGWFTQKELAGLTLVSRTYVELFRDVFLNQPSLSGASRILEGDMKSPQEVWREYIDAWNRHDIDGILEMVADDFIYDERPMTMAHPLRGRPAFRDYLTRTFAAFPDLTIELTSCDALAVAESVMSGTYAGRIAGGKRIAVRVACVLEVKAGTLLHERLYWDRANTLRQLGRTAAVLAVAFQRPVLNPA